MSRLSKPLHLVRFRMDGKALPLWLVNAYALSGLEWRVNEVWYQDVTSRRPEPTARYDITCSACGYPLAVAEHVHPSEASGWVSWGIEDYIQNANYIRANRVCKCSIQTVESSAEPSGT